MTVARPAVAEPALGQQPLEVEKPDEVDERYWSVTTLIKAIGDNRGLIEWAAQMTATCAVKEFKSLQFRLDNEGEDVAYEWLCGAKERPPKGERQARDLGTDIHAAIEQYTLTGQRPEVDDELRPYMERFDEWAQDFQPTYDATEVVVYSPTYGYAGQSDAFVTVDGVRFIVDYKTSKKSETKYGKVTKPYPDSAALQLAAYRGADMAAVWRPRRFEYYRRRYYLLSPLERELAVPVPEVDMGLILHITPKHCMAYPIECGPDVHRDFLYTMEVARWVYQTSKTVMGAPLTRGGA